MIDAGSPGVRRSIEEDQDRDDRHHRDRREQASGEVAEHRDARVGPTRQRSSGEA